MVFEFDGLYFMYQVMAMGLSSAPKLFTDFMRLPMYAIKQKCPEIFYVTVKKRQVTLQAFRKDSDFTIFNRDGEEWIKMAAVLHYLDDIFGGHVNEEIAWRQFHTTKEALRDLTLEAQPGKDEEPNHICVILGDMIQESKE